MENNLKSDAEEKPKVKTHQSHQEEEQTCDVIPTMMHTIQEPHDNKKTAFSSIPYNKRSQ